MEQRATTIHPCMGVHMRAHSPRANGGRNDGRYHKDFESVFPGVAAAGNEARRTGNISAEAVAKVFPTKIDLVPDEPLENVLGLGALQCEEATVVPAHL